MQETAGGDTSRGAFNKFCNSTVKKNGNVTKYTLFFNIITTEFNAFETFFWQTVNSTKITRKLCYSKDDRAMRAI